MDKILDHTLFSWGKLTLHFSDIILIGGSILSILIILRITHFLLKRIEERGRIDSGRRNSIYLIIKYLLIIFVFAFTLEGLGVKLSIFLAGSAALLVGLGLGLKETFNDFVSGILLLVEGTIQIGDVLEVEGIVGRVTIIHLRTSEIVTRDGINIIVPNHKFVTENVINWSHNKKPTRFKVAVGVSYQCDVNQVKEILLKSIEELPGAITGLKEYNPVIRLSDFAESSVNFDILFWSYDYFRFETIKSDLRFIISRRFKENNIEIPFPQRDVHIRNGSLKEGL